MPENDYSGRVLDNQYKVLYQLGESGRGSVYLGEKTANSRQVAIKFLHSDLASNAEAVKRFFREARAAVELRHKNIIEVYDIGLSDDGDPYIVMEYLEGESLSDMLSRVGALQVSAALGIIDPLLRAIGAMHEKGILHRDIKTENIYMVHRAGERPTVKLIDFGLTKFTEGEEATNNLTVAGITLGDFSYIAPEQIKDASKVDQRADLYSIGVIMYEMLTGQLPYTDLPEDKRLAAKLTKSPTPPKKLARGIPGPLDAIIMQALSIDRKERPATAKKMLLGFTGIKGYKGRSNNLNKCAAGVARLTIAGGNFPSPNLPSSTPPPAPRPKAKKIIDWVLRTWPGRAAGAAAALLSAVIIAVAAGGEEPADTVVPVPVPIQPTAAQPPPQPQARSSEVQIEVRGIPAGARIYYDDALVPLNPFRVSLKEIIVPLKIEADGYETYTTSLVPAEDQVVKVDMKQRTAEPETDEEAPVVQGAYTPPALDPEPRREARPRRSGASGGRREKKSGSDFRSIRKGLKVSDEFE